MSFPLEPIRNKFDLEAAKALVAAGYPAVAPMLGHLFEWIQDCNWPVAHIIAPFLASVGSPVIPEIERVFQTDDLQWKYWCISAVIHDMDAEAANALRGELERLARNPSALEHEEELDEVAQDALDNLWGEET